MFSVHEVYNAFRFFSEYSIYRGPKKGSNVHSNVWDRFPYLINMKWILIVVLRLPSSL